MATDDQLTSTPSITKRPVSRKHRIVTTGNNGISRLPSLLSKSTTFLSTSESMHYKTYRSRHKDMLSTSSSLKIERPTTNIISQRRLPPLNDNNQKQKSEYQRRQIYALNHLMRELEQEQFQQFCKLNGIGTESSEITISNDEDPNKQSTTITLV